MKKLLILLLGIALVISLSAFSCGSKAQGDDVAENTTKTNSVNKAEKKFFDWGFGK